MQARVTQTLRAAHFLVSRVPENNLSSFARLESPHAMPRVTHRLLPSGTHKILPNHNKITQISKLHSRITPVA
jgi:hypothetical protein